jgi:hypothetical protein
LQRFRSKRARDEVGADRGEYRQAAGAIAKAVTKQSECASGEARGRGGFGTLKKGRDLSGLYSFNERQTAVVPLARISNQFNAGATLI